MNSNPTFKDFSFEKVFKFSLIIVFLIVSVLLAYQVKDNSNDYKHFVKSYQYRYEYARFTGKSKMDSLLGIFSSVAGSKVYADKNANKELFAQSVPVILYHSISAEKGKYSVSPENFKNQMFSLKKLGYTTLTTDQYQKFIDGSFKPPAKSVLITFDDGTRTGYDQADPIFRALDFHATNFIITKNSIEEGGSHYYLNPDDLKTMQKSGRWDLEVHTNVGHIPYKIDQNGKTGTFYANKLWLEDKNRLETDQEYSSRVENDLISAKKDLESITGKSSTALAFPLGDYGQDSVNYPGAQKALLKIVQKNFDISMMQYYSARGNSQEYFGDNVLAARRIEVLPEWSGDNLMQNIEMGSSKSISYKDNFEQNKGWRRDGGNVAIENNSLKLNSNSPNRSSTASAILDGGMNWTNYSFTAEISLNSGSNMTLIARKINPNNYIGCDYSNGAISVIQVKEGIRNILNRGDYILNPYDKGKYGITVENNMIGCTLNGNLMAIGTSSTIPTSGGISISIWDQVVGVASADVTSVTVEPTQKSVDTALLNVDMVKYNNWENFNSQPKLSDIECEQTVLDDEVSSYYPVCNEWDRVGNADFKINTGVMTFEYMENGELNKDSGSVISTTGVKSTHSLSNSLISGGSSGE